MVLAAHPNLAVPADWMKRLAPQMKVIVLAHGVDVWQPLPLGRHAAFLAADIVLAASSSTVQKLTEVQGVPPERIRKLPWPLDPDVLSMADAPRTISPLPKNFPPSPVILTVGRWAASEQYKGADDLIRALAQLRQRSRTLISGRSRRRRRSSAPEKIAADLGVASAVRFLQAVPRQELAACYARADIFALPSTGEGFGFVFLEAMAFGKPIVAADAGGPTDLVNDGINGLLVPPRDSTALAQALDQLIARRFPARQARPKRRRKSSATNIASKSSRTPSPGFSPSAAESLDVTPNQSGFRLLPP